MEIFVKPNREEWPKLVQRCQKEEASIAATVQQIIDEVRQGGDAAIRAITERVDGFAPKSLRVTQAEIDEACASIPAALKAAMEHAKANIWKFHSAQMPTPVDVLTTPGVRCLQRPVPIQNVGLYIPGGKAPLFSTVLMLALPAKIAGCRRVCLCTPPSRGGKIAPEILYAAWLCGIDEVYAVGGAQAIAAMAYGTETIGKVDKIFGPGNRYVTTAKQLLSANTVAIDMPAGPSEVMVMADSTANPQYVAADLLSQAEHGEDSQAMLVCSSEDIANAVVAAVEEQKSTLPRRAIVDKALENSRIIVLPERDDMIDFANLYASEHLIIAMADPWSVAVQITAAGSVFVGNYSCESAGDYASGTNHTLPTSGWATAYSGVNLDSYMRKITYQELTAEGIANLCDTIATMAQAEGLDAHARAATIRTNR